MYIDTKYNILHSDKLMIVAHPDDEILWGGMNLLIGSGWHIIVCTNKNNKNRTIELLNTLKTLGVYKIDMFDIEDEAIDEQKIADQLFLNKTTLLYKYLQKLNKQKWNLVLTHSKSGEYLNTHHIAIHKLVKSIFKNAQFFKVDKMLSKKQLEQKAQLCKYYYNTQNICKMISNDNIYNDDFDLQRNFYQKEKIYVKPIKHIPKIIHQIWLGDNAPSYKEYLLNTVRDMCYKNKFDYKLWTNEDLNEVNFPITYKYIQKSIKIGKKKKISKWAQIADLARYEIIFKYGGLYFDSLFELSNNFFKEFNRLHNKYEILICNEEPVGLKKSYLSNGFFASIPKHPIIYKLINEKNLNKIDFNSKYINTETGPTYFKKAFNKSNINKVYIFKPTEIYPFLTHETNIRKKQKNKCIVNYNVQLNNNIIEINDNDDMYLRTDCFKIYDSLTIYHSGLGGTWSS
jgi:mannosyltransferase OCH1-like enzyme